MSGTNILYVPEGEVRTLGPVWGKGFPKGEGEGIQLTLGFDEGADEGWGGESEGGVGALSQLTLGFYRGKRG